MDTRERLIEIAHHWNDDELICKACGSVTKVEQITIQEVATKTGAKKYKAVCPECDSYIKFLHSKKAFRFFKSKAVGLVAVEDCDLSYLQWMIQIEHSQFNKVRGLRMAVLDAIDRKMNMVIPIGDYDPPEREQQDLDQINKLKTEMLTINKEINRITLESVNYDGAKLDQVAPYLKKLTRQVNKKKLLCTRLETKKVAPK